MDAKSIKALLKRGRQTIPKCRARIKNQGHAEVRQSTNKNIGVIQKHKPREKTRSRIIVVNAETKGSVQLSSKH